ncbi:splicing factor PWI [Rhodotorula toruloides ATCC 204091]|nr:splicing factor PWI [Rhodotorula toruloides ATCC 204091]
MEHLQRTGLVNQAASPHKRARERLREKAEWVLGSRRGGKAGGAGTGATERVSRIQEVDERSEGAEGNAGRTSGPTSTLSPLAAAPATRSSAVQPRTILSLRISSTRPRSISTSTTTSLASITSDADSETAEDAAVFSTLVAAFPRPPAIRVDGGVEDGRKATKLGESPLPSPPLSAASTVRGEIGSSREADEADTRKQRLGQAFELREEPEPARRPGPPTIPLPAGRIGSSEESDESDESAVDARFGRGRRRTRSTVSSDSTDTGSDSDESLRMENITAELSSLIDSFRPCAEHTPETSRPTSTSPTRTREKERGGGRKVSVASSVVSRASSAWSSSGGSRMGQQENTTGGYRVRFGISSFLTPRYVQLFKERIGAGAGVGGKVGGRAKKASEGDVEDEKEVLRQSIELARPHDTSLNVSPIPPTRLRTLHTARSTPSLRRPSTLRPPSMVRRHSDWDINRIDEEAQKPVTVVEENAQVAQLEDKSKGLRPLFTASAATSPSRLPSPTATRTRLPTAQAKAEHSPSISPVKTRPLLTSMSRSMLRPPTVRADTSPTLPSRTAPRPTILAKKPSMLPLSAATSALPRPSASRLPPSGSSTGSSIPQSAQKGLRRLSSLGTLAYIPSS